MAIYSFTLDGGEELKNMLRAAGDGSGKEAGQAIWEEANKIFAKSQVLVPVDTGVLRGSGGVSAPQADAKDLFVDIYYGGPAAPYALMVHEIQGNYHNPPTQAKYLEQPFMEALPEIQKNMAARIMDLISRSAK
jgi:hypothetical protein